MQPLLSTFTIMFSLSKLFPLVFLFTKVPECQAECKLIGPISPNETQFLNKIKPLTGSTFEVKDVQDSRYTYKVSICSQVPGSEQNVGAMQYSHSAEKNFTLGKIDMVDVTGGTDWILLTYYGGDNYGSHCNGSERVTNIIITCDPEVLKGKFQSLEERRSRQSNCFYFFELSSNVTCLKPEEKPYKLSSGSVFCILFFTVISVYLICGFLYKRIVIGAKGLEQIPNYSFWRDFGNLQADGCDYFCRCGPRQESLAYRGIDDHLKVDEERDDQLLN